MNSFEKRAKKVAGYKPKKSNNSGNSYRDDSFVKRAEDIVKRNTIQKLRDKTEARSRALNNILDKQRSEQEEQQAEKLQPDPATLPGTLGRQMLDLATKKVEDTLAGKYNFYAPAFNPFQPVPKQDSGATEEKKKNFYPKASESKYARKKADDILRGMMDQEAERAKDAYDAALLQYHRAEENYYAVPDGDFEKAQNDYLAAEEQLQKAERELRNLQGNGKEIKTPVRDSASERKKDEASQYFTNLIAKNSWVQEQNGAFTMPSEEKIAGMGAEELRALQNSINSYADSVEKSELAKLQGEWKQALREGRPQPEIDEISKQINQTLKTIDEWRNRADQLSWQMNLAERRNKIDEYEQYRGNAEFQAVADEARNTPYSRKEDPVGYYLNNREFWDAIEDNEFSADNWKHYGMLKEPEIEMYYYLLGTKGSKAASQYLDDIQILLDQRYYEQQQQLITETYQDSKLPGKIGMNVVGAIGNAIGGIPAVVGDVSSVLSGQGYNPYNQGHQMLDYSNAVQGATSEEIAYRLLDDETKAMMAEYEGLLQQEAQMAISGNGSQEEYRQLQGRIEEVGNALKQKQKENDQGFNWGKFWTQTYQAVYSGASSAVGAMMFNKGYTAVMGANAASQRARELWEKGASPEQIGLGAVASGLIEMATEKYSVEAFTENFLKGNIQGPKDWLVKTLIQGFNEGSEEVASEIANQVANALILAGNSDNQREIQALMADGMSREEAEKQALINRAVDIFWAGYGGFISGGTMGGIGGPVNTFTNHVLTGKGVMQNNAGQDLVQAAKDSGVDEQVRKLAMEKASGDYEAMNAWKRMQADQAMGKLYEQTIQTQEDQANQAVRDSFQQVAEDKVREAQEAEQSQETEGTTQEDPKTAAQALTKAAYGEELTDAEKKTVEAVGGETLIDEIANSRDFREAASARTEEANRRLSDTLSMTKDTTQQRELVSSFAKENGMDEGVMLESIRRNQDAYAFTEAWQSAYDMGQSGVALRYAKKASANSYLTQAQIETAYNEGRKAAESYEAEEGPVSNGGQWNDRAYPGGKVRAVESGTAAQGQNIQQGAVGGIAETAEKITSIQLGLENGTENRNLRRVAEAAYSEDVKTAAKVAKDSGLVFVPFSGGAIETLETVNGSKIKVKSRGCVVNGKMYVRVDDNTFTADQIARHEAAHEQIRKGEIDVEDTSQRLLERYSPEEIEAIIQLYASAYGDSGLTAEQVLEEIICDSLGKMNAFATESTERVAGEVGVFLRNVRKNAVNSTQAKQEPVTKRSVQEQERSTQKQERERSNQVKTEKVDSAKAKPVGTFAFHYNSIAPMMSLFDSDGKGRFTIYDDGTLDIRDDTMQGANTLEGFRSQGMMELYDIYFDGQKWTQGKDMPTGYYRIERVTQKPTVKKTPTGGYAIDQKGVMRLVDIETKNTTGDGGGKYSREIFADEAKAFSDEITRWEKEGKESGQRFILGSTGEVLQGLGAIENDIYMNGDKIKTILEEHKEITIDEIKQIPKILNDPTLILKSRNVGRSGAQNTRMVLYGSVKGKNGIPVMVVFDIRPMENHLVINDMQKVTSAYTKTNDGVSFVENSYVMFADKKRATSLLRSIGFQMPIELQQSGYIGSITYRQRSVNLYGEKFSNVFRQNSTENKYSREMDTVKALERQKKLLQEQRDYWKDQTRLTKTAKADKDAVRKLGREILREYSSSIEVDEILTDLQWLADDAVGNGKASYQELTDAAEKIARKVLEGSGVDVNGDLAEIRQALKQYLRSTPINITESIKAGIPDFADFKKRNRELHFREDGSGTDVDAMWLELQDQFGTGMFPEKITKPEDQVRYIAEELEDIREVMVNPYGKEMELAVQQLTYDILYRTSAETQQMKPTKADQAVERATKEMQQLLEEGRRRENARIENAQKTSIRQQIRTISDKFQRMATRPGKGISQHAPEGLRKAVVDFCEVFTESELRRMDRWQRNLEYRADELGRKASNVYVATGVVVEAEAIRDAQARRDRMTARLTKLQNEYAAMQKDGQYQTTYDETVAEMIKNISEMLDGKDLYQLEVGDLRKVQQTMSAIYYTITNANKAFSMGKDKTIIDMAVKWAKEIRQVNPRQAGMMIAGRRFMQWQMSPDTFFNYTCGYIKGNEGKVIQKGFQQGAERMMGVQREFYQMFREFTESKDKAVHKELADLMNYSSKRLVNWGLKDLEGNEVKTTRGMMMQAYMLLNQADSFESLKHGGFSIPNAARYYKGDIAGAYGDAVETTMLSVSIGTGFTEMIQRNKDLRSRMEDLQQKAEISETESYKIRYQQEINELENQIRENQQKMEAITSAAAERLYNLQNAIEKQLTPLEKKLIERAHEWYSKSGKMMADVFEQMYGYRPMLVENYVPIHRDQTTIKTDIRDMAGAEKAFNLENSGFTIDRVKNSQPILLTDFFQELNRQSDKMARYVGFAQVQKDFGKIWKTRIDSNGMTVNTLVRARFGAGKTTLGVSGEEYVNHYIADVAGGHSSDDILGKFYGNYAAATLRFNPRVAVSQAASIPTAASVVGWKSMAAGFARGVPKAWNKDYRNTLAEKNVWFYQRYRGQGGSTELAELKNKGGMIERIAESKTGKLLFNWCQAVDVWATGSIMWSAAEDYVQSKGIAKGSAEYEAEVNRVYTDIIRKSQPNYTTTERSDLLRDQRSHVKLLSMFKTQSNQNLNLLLEANGEFMRMKQDLKNGRNGVTEADVKAARHKLYNAETGVVVGGQLAFVMLRTLVNFAFRAVKPYRDKETDEVTLQATLTAMGNEFLSAMFGTVALGGHIYDVINSVWSGENFYGLSDSALSTISGVVENTVNILQSWKDEDETVTMNQIWKEVNSLCTVLKIPSGNAKKYVYDMMKSYGTDIKNGDLLAFTSEDTTKKQYRARIVKHYLAGNMDKAADALAMLFENSSADTDDDANTEIASGMRTYLKGLYIKGEVSDVEAEKIMEYTGTDDPESYTAKWDFQLAYPEIDASDALVKAYGQKGSISDEVFLDAWEFANNAQADKDKNGKTINGSKKQKIVDYVQAIPGLTKSQKKKLFELLGAGSVKGTPWE